VKNIIGNKTVDGPNDFHNMEKKNIKYYGSQWGLSTVWLPTFFKISKKFIQVWKNLRVSRPPE